MNIVQALDDAELFQPLFAGASWAPWRAFLKSLFGLSMSDAELALYREHTKRQTSPTKPFNEAALVIGRRGGKSRILALIAVFLGCFKDYTPYLATGEVATISIIARDRRQARVIFRFISGMLDATPMLRAMVTDESAEAISLSNRVVIEIHTCSFRATRGYSYGAVLCDEIAFWRDETSANPDTEILRALRPGLASIPGSMLLIASSPYRKAGVLYNVFARHFGKDDARTLVWRAATLEMNPSLSPAVIEEAYADDPASAASEYGAQFRDDINDFVSRDVVEACVIRGRGELLPARGITYRAFVDPSGGSSDSMTLAICHRHQDTAILDAVREVKPPFSPEQVVKDFAATLRSYHVSRVTGDHYGGEWPRERFRLAGIQYVLSEQPKGDIYLNSLPLLNSGKVQLLDHQRLISQFIGLERRTARSGRDSIDHSPGQHDDIVNAVCGGLLLVGQHAPMRVSPRALERSRQTGLRHAY